MAPIDNIAQIVADAIIRALKDREGELTKIAEAGGKQAHSDPLGGVTDLSLLFSIFLNVFAVTNPEFAIPVAIKDAAEAAGGKLGVGIGAGYFLGWVLQMLGQPYIEIVQHKIAAEAQSELWDANSLAGYVAKGLLSIQDGRHEAAGNNFDANHFNVMVENAVQFPDMGTLLVMRDRSLISENDLDGALKRHGFPDSWIEPIKGLSRLLLSPADLALAALRGNLDENVARAYARILSVDDNDFTVLMDNTGEPLGEQELAEALRRGFIDESRFARGVRQSRIRNEWLDVALALRHEPMSTADAIRAVVQNYIPDDEGRAIAEQNGLEPAHYDPLRSSYGRPLSHDEMITLLRRGEATVEEVKQAIRESDLKDKYIDKAIELGRQLIPERTIVSMIDHGVLTHDEALTHLLQHGYSQEDADALIKLGSAQKTSAQKTLSRTDIVSMYADALLTRTEAHSHLVSLGYHTDDATSLLALADAKLKAAALKTTERGIEATLKAHHITADEAKRQLLKAGVSQEQANGLVDQWITQRQTATRSLTEAQIISLGTHGLIDATNVHDRLVSLGLAPPDANLLMQLHNIGGGGSGGTALTRQDIEDLYATGKLTQAQAMADLQRAGYTADNAAAILSLITPKAP